MSRTQRPAWLCFSRAMTLREQEHVELYLVCAINDITLDVLEPLCSQIK
jgi:hypothetical protein